MSHLPVSHLPDGAAQLQPQETHPCIIGSSAALALVQTRFFCRFVVPLNICLPTRWGWRLCVAPAPWDCPPVPVTVLLPTGTLGPALEPGAALCCASLPAPPWPPQGPPGCFLSLPSRMPQQGPPPFPMLQQRLAPPYCPHCSSAVWMCFFIISGVCVRYLCHSHSPPFVVCSSLRKLPESFH